MRRRLLGLLTTLLGAALVLASFAGLLFAQFTVMVALQAPDPFIENGDPCCGHPDDWGEVALGAVSALAGALVLGAVFALGVGLILRVGREHATVRRRLLRVPLGAAALMAAVIAVLLLPALDDGRALPDCETYRFDRTAWGDYDGRRPEAYALAHCRVLTGMTAKQVRALLGRPYTHEPGVLGYDNLRVFVEDGRATGADYEGY